MNAILNVSGYRFVTIDDPAALRAQLQESASALGLRGTLLLATEGINLMLAGTANGLREFLKLLRADERFADLETKESWSAQQPFHRLRVKVKPEIIRMNHPAIQPQQGRAPAVDALTLRRWLDQGRDDAGRELVMLDTRNAFEVDHGTFAGALDWRLGKFSDFPAAFERHAGELEGKTVVSFCTGGIRCEKAALYMGQAGLPHVFQLDGGILRYFELAQGRHFQGDCFVFDQRELLGQALYPRPAT